MKKNFLDPNLKNKKNIVESNIQLVEYNNKFFPLPTEIEISESGTCNRTCSFCPRSAPDFKDLKEFITEDLFTKLCTELKNFNYKGTIRFSGFVEPMLDKNIYKLISACRDFLPSCNIELVTNGDILNLERLKKLFINGLNRILISAYDDQKTATELENLCVKAELKKNQYLVRHRYYSSEKDFGITLSNRAGLMENAEFKIKSLKEPLKLPCFIPSYTFFLNYDGDVLICPHDWGKKIILGNLKHQKFLDIWLSKKAILTRYKLSNADRKFMPCNVCDVNGTLMGKTNSDYFKNV